MMRWIDWAMIIFIIVGVPMVYASIKRINTCHPCEPIFVPMFGLLIGGGYLLGPPVMLIIFHYTPLLEWMAA